MCHLTYLLGHITKNGQQASFKILNLINRTEKDYVPEPDPNKVVLRVGKTIELKFTDPNDDINTEIIIDPVKGKSKVTLKEHVVVSNNSFIVLKDVTNGELAQGFEHLVKDGFVMEQKKILSRGELVTTDGIADLLTSRLPGGLNINLTGFDGVNYVVTADVFVTSFLKADGTITPEDLCTKCLDDAISRNEVVSINVHTEEGSVTDEYKSMHPNSVFEDLADGVIVEYVKAVKPAPLAATAPEPISGETGLPAEPLRKKEEPDGNEGQESPDLVATAGMKVWFGVTPEDGAVVRMYNNAEGNALLMEFTDSDFEKSVVYRGVVYEVVDNITKDTFKDYKQISELMEHFKLVVPEQPSSEAETREELPPPPAEIPTEPEEPNSQFRCVTLNLKAGDIIEFVSVDPEAGVVRLEAANIQTELTDPNFNSEFKYGKYRVKEDVSDLLTSYRQLHELMERFEEVQEQPKEEQQVEQKTEEAEEQLNEIGTDPKDLPPKKGIEEEHTANEFLQILFGTSSPTILHIFKMLNKYGKSSKTYQMTQTFPTIVDIVFTSPMYHYSIVRMKNGCYYKVFVAHTELERENSGCWEDTHDERGRWMHLINVSDRQVNDAFRGRL